MAPKYQFHLEVEHVVFPEEGKRPDDPEMIWSRDSFAVAESRESARYEEIPGYHVTQDLEQAILQCLTQTLLIDPATAKVLPISEYDSAKVGRRVSAHPLHETFIGKDSRRQRDDFYRKSDPDALVADIDPMERAPTSERQQSLFAEPVERVQRVYTMRLSKLEELWRAAAGRNRRGAPESRRE